MTDITYGPNTRNWDEKKKLKLIERFNDELEELRRKGEIQFERTDAPASKTGYFPYVDGTFIEGVVIRNITSFSMEDETKLKSCLDKIYDVIMTDASSDR